MDDFQVKLFLGRWVSPKNTDSPFPHGRPRSTRRPKTTQVDGFSWPLYLIRPKQNLRFQGATGSGLILSCFALDVICLAKKPVFGTTQYFVDCEHILSKKLDIY